MPDRAAVPLALPTMPRRVTARLDGWTLGGLHADGSADSTLQLVREATRGGGHAATGGETLAPSALPAFAKVTRRITLDLRWEVTTTVERASTSGSAVVIAVPLLAGESVTSADARVEDGKVLVSLAAGEAATEWTSGLAEGPTIDLRAPATSGWTEVWRLAAGPRWHVEWSGLPPVLPEEGQGREPEWHPWPGEELHLAVTRPEGVPGAVLTVDSSVLTMTPGIRATDVVLGFTLRTSRGGDQVVTLPEGAELQSLSVDDHAQAQRQEGRSVRIGLTPGVHAVAMSWREPRGLSWHWRASEVDLGVPSVNARSRIVLGSNRWVLHVHGPPLGPAVLFWSELVVLALLAAGLARLRLTPLGFAAWLLLLVGLSQIPIWFAAIVVGWLLLLGLRARGGASLPPWIFDLAQVMLVVATCAALVVLFAAIRQGLLGEPQMQVVGNQSTASEMNWYQDRVDGALPRPTVVSAPRLVYRLAMLLWALWLASSLLRWLRWGWSAFVAGGAWKRRPPAVKPEKPARGAKAPFPASPPPEKPPAAG